MSNHPPLNDTETWMETEDTETLGKRQEERVCTLQSRADKQGIFENIFFNVILLSCYVLAERIHLYTGAQLTSAVKQCATCQISCFGTDDCRGGSDAQRAGGGEP